MTETPTLPPLHMRRNTFDPTEELRRLRESAPVHKFISQFGMTAYLVTRHHDIKEILADHERFSNRRPPGFVPPIAAAVSDEEQDRFRAGNLLGLDPPDHQRLRRMLTAEFTVRRMTQLEPRVAEIVKQHLDAMEAAGPPVELVSAFALPIPSLVICELLGVPYGDREGFQQRSARQLDFAIPMQQRLALQREGRDYMRSLVRRARCDPGDDMLGMLLRDHGDELSEDELVGIAGLLLLAGHETKANMLALGVLALLVHPDQLAVVRDKPAMVPAAVEEMMRYLSIVQTAIPRFTTTDVEVAGTVIPAGQLVVLSLPSGNRDPEFLAAPDTLDVARGRPGHLAFGYGVHHCLGAPLARMEMRIAFPALLRRFPGLALAEPLADVHYRAFHFIYGVRSLNVTWR
ncbi:MAG TPA: cytochrome P450 [Mycobacterium sp.]|nr:cytochrome P450 [Mycobacterium sp.]